MTLDEFKPGDSATYKDIAVVIHEVFRDGDEIVGYSLQNDQKANGDRPFIFASDVNLKKTL